MLSADVLIDAIKTSVPPSALEWAKKARLTDAEFVETNGAGTQDIARKLNIDCNEARKQLDKLTKQGLIFKSKRNGGGYCRWWPDGFMAELKSQNVGAAS